MERRKNLNDKFGFADLMKIKDFIDYEQPNEYIVESDRYSSKYSTPVLTAGHSFILGYINENNGIYKKGPCIIFDDFTTSVHYVDFPFKVKSSAMKILTAKSNADLKYCYYLLLSLSNMPPNHKRQWISTTSEKNHLLPSIDKQISIVKQLDLISGTIANYTNQIENLNNLVKARFIELFGTVRENPYKYPTATLKEVCHKITDGKHGGCEQEENSGYYYIGAREIYDGEIHYDTAPQIKYTDFSKDYRRCNIEQGDMVIVNTGATIGKSAIASSSLTERTLLQKSVALIKVKPNIISAEFLRYCYMANPSMYMVESASAQPNLLLSKINTTVIYLPPMDLQLQFADFVQQVDKSKLAVQQSLEKTQLLFDSLMQEYFGEN